MKDKRLCKYCNSLTQSVKDKDGNYTCVSCMNVKCWLQNNPIARNKILVELNTDGNSMCKV